MRNIRYLLALAVVVTTSTSCGSLATQGRSPVYLVIAELSGQRGGLDGDFGNPVPSDVVTKPLSLAVRTGSNAKSTEASPPDVTRTFCAKAKSAVPG